MKGVSRGQPGDWPRQHGLTTTSWLFHRRNSAIVRRSFISAGIMLPSGGRQSVKVKMAALTMGGLDAPVKMGHSPQPPASRTPSKASGTLAPPAADSGDVGDTSAAGASAGSISAPPNHHRAP